MDTMEACSDHFYSVNFEWPVLPLLGTLPVGTQGNMPGYVLTLWNNFHTDSVVIDPPHEFIVTWAIIIAAAVQLLDRNNP